MGEIEIRERLKGKVLIAGVGNTLRGDDGAGVELIWRLQGKIKAELLECGEAPENYLGTIISMKPDTIVIVDAVELGQPPGTVSIIDIEDVEDLGIPSTHSISLKVLMNYLKTGTGADIFLLGIQPASIELEERISKEVSEALDKLEDILRKIFC